MLAKILSPSSERGADYWFITYDCSGTVVTHECSQTCSPGVVPAKHVQFFKVKYSFQKKWHTEPFSQ